MKKLFSEFNIKNVKMKNCICIFLMVVGFSNDGFVIFENVECYKKLV